MSLHLSKCHIVGNLMSRLIFYFYFSVNGDVIDIRPNGMTILNFNPENKRSEQSRLQKTPSISKGPISEMLPGQNPLVCYSCYFPYRKLCIFSCFCCRLLLFFFKIDFYTKYYRNTIRVSSCLETDQDRRILNILRGGCRISGKRHPGSFVFMVVGFALVIVSHFFKYPMRMK